MIPSSLHLTALSTAYAAGTFQPTELVRAIHAKVPEQHEKNVWISHASLDALLARAAELEALQRTGADLPLYGIPFAVKDNIDVAGVPTTAGCPEYAYTPSVSAAVVDRLLRAGAIYIGKTNLDQFATGLVGTRSPYGPCPNAFDPRYISGGSSSGSAIAVATGVVSFALGTDTAGSGRVPAGLNNIVGLKPTRGLISTRGVVPACRSLDCVSIFALTSIDAHTILNVARGFDAADPYSRAPDTTGSSSGSSFRFGVPKSGQREFYDDAAAQRLYEDALARLEKLGGIKIEIDYAPFRETAALLYEGPWVAERLAAVGDFARKYLEAVHPVVREILFKGDKFSAADLFLAQDKLQELKRACYSELSKIDFLALPTAPTIYPITDVLAEPINRNTELGYYTNFVNLLDLSAIAVPSGIRSDGLPFGITLVAEAFAETKLCQLGAAYHTNVGGKLGATEHSVPTERQIASAPGDNVRVAVVGAHLTGQPLNYQLVERDARLIKTCRTAKTYRLYALRGTVPPKPGLIHQPDNVNDGIEVEVWEMPARHFGSFVAAIPSPLGIGTLTLDSGEQVKGFICEAYAIADAVDITQHGSWRAYLKAKATSTQ